jgi:hypothetical protein
MSSRLDFDERRARALEGVVQYRPGAVAPLQPPPIASEARGGDVDQAERRTRRRRRRRRRPGERPEGREFRNHTQGGMRDAAQPPESASGYGASPQPRGEAVQVGVDRAEASARDTHEPADREPTSES